MSQLFDMVAGTSTGGILAAALSCPAEEDSKRGLYSDKILDLYKTQGKEIFNKAGVNKGLLATIVFFSIIIGGVLGYFLGVRFYSDSEMEETYLAFHKYIKEVKKSGKGTKGKDAEQQHYPTLHPEQNLLMQ